MKTYGENAEKMAGDQIKNVVIEEYFRVGDLEQNALTCNIRGQRVSTLYLKCKRLCRCSDC